MLLNYFATLGLGLLAICSAISALPDAQRRKVCYEEEMLLLYEYSAPDSQQLCSSILGITDQTVTLPPSTLSTTVTTVFGTTYDSLETTTVTSTVAQVLDRRVDGPSAAGNAESGETHKLERKFGSDADPNAVLADAMYSACSCLHIKPKTIKMRPTVQKTLTVKSSEHRTQPTLTGGVTSITVTKDVVPTLVSSAANLTAGEPKSLIPTGTVVIPPNTSAGYSPPYGNMTVASSGSIFRPPINTSFVTLHPTAPSASPSTHPNMTAISNGTTNGTTGSPQAGDSISFTDCPSINGTHHTDSTNLHNIYQIQCYRQYPPSGYLDFHAENFEACMAQCSYINEEARCYGVTWLQSNPGVNCYLDMARYGGSSFNGSAVSAVLLTGPYPVPGAYGGK